MKKYNFPMTLDKQFKEFLEKLHQKYGTDIMKIEGMAPSQLDTCEFFAKFLEADNVANATTDDNANVTDKNINTMINESQKPFRRLLSRNKLFIEIKEEFGLDTAKDWLESVVSGQLYEHDSFSSSQMPYCFAFSLKNIVHRGLYFLKEMKAGRPKHWDTFNHHTLEFISYATNMQSGAVGIPDYLIYAYYFFKKDTEDMPKEAAAKYRNQKFQEFVFNLNQPYLKGGVQSAYSNVSILDDEHLTKFFEGEVFPDGTEVLSHRQGIKDFQESFLSYVGELRKEKFHTFPVISASLVFRNGEYQDEETAKMVVRHNWSFGFNDVNIMNTDRVTSLASCCRLVSDKEKLENNKGRTFNSIGGSDLNVGSSKVVTLNMVRLALEAEEKEGDTFENYKELIAEKVKLIHKYHFAHRKTLQKLIDKGMLPLYSYDMMDLSDQFATVGINGVYEGIKILRGIVKTGQGYKYSEEGFKMVEDVFEVINTLNEKTTKKYGFTSNTEEIPAESTAIKLNKKDRIIFGNRKINKELGEDCYIYGNQWIPLKEDANIFDRIEAGHLDNLAGGGAILHLNLGENFNTFEDAWEFTVGLAKKGIKYFSYISMIDICEEDHSFFGDICPICGGESVSKGIKIVGYLVKQESYKDERKRELHERKFYDLN